MVGYNCMSSLISNIRSTNILCVYVTEQGACAGRGKGVESFFLNLHCYYLSAPWIYFWPSQRSCTCTTYTCTCTTYNHLSGNDLLIKKKWEANHILLFPQSYHMLQRKCAVKMPAELRFLVCPGPLHRAPSHATRTSLHVLVIWTLQYNYNNSVSYTESETLTFA